jgi:hypothetical protein
MTSAIAVRSDVQPFRNATRSTGERCPGVGQRPGTGYWDRAVCPGCGLSQRVTGSHPRVMMSHYVTRPNETPALTVAVPEPVTVTAISTRLEETIANLTAPTEPSTVGEFIRATIALTAALAAAQARIAELEQSPPTSAPVTNETVEQWQADWLELNHLLAFYAIERGWCPQFEETIRRWNNNFQQGYLLSRNEVRRDSFNHNRVSSTQQRANRSTARQRKDAALTRFRESSVH